MRNTDPMAALAEIIPAERISTADDDLLRHAYDAWPMATKWRQRGEARFRPDAVVRPRERAEIGRLLRWATERGVPVVPWGAGSSVTGAPLPLRGGISLDMAGLDQVLALDQTNLFVQAQAGLLGHKLETALNQAGYTLNHSPQSLDRSTVGGWIATRASGQFSSRWGGIEDLVLALTVVLPTGEIVETRLAPRAALGPEERDVFLGSEGTLGVITDVTLKIFPQADARRYESLHFPDVDAGLTAMRLIMRAGLRPFLLRLYDADEARHAMQQQDYRGCAMFLGCEGQAAVADAELAECLAIATLQGGAALGPDAALAWMARRYDFSLIETLLAQPGGFAETIEVAHFWDRIGDTYRALKTRLATLTGEVLGHFSHAYPQGTSLYIILLGQVADDAQAEARLGRIWQVAMETCLEQGAVTSHHHGVGLARLPYVRQDVGTGMLVRERIKAALDPAGIMNPGKLGIPDRR